MSRALEPDDLWKLLQIAVDEEYMYIKENQNRTALYAGFVMTILGASVAGTMEAKASFHWYILAAGPVVAGVLSFIGIKSAGRFYQRFLEALSIRAKVEADLGLADRPPPAIAAVRPYWANKPYAAPRWLEGRRKPEWEDEDGTTPEVDGVQRWIDDQKSKGEQRIVRWLFSSLIAVSIILCIGFIVIGTRFPCMPPVSP